MCGERNRGGQVRTKTLIALRDRLLESFTFKEAVNAMIEHRIDALTDRLREERAEDLGVCKRCRRRFVRQDVMPQWNAFSVPWPRSEFCLICTEAEQTEAELCAIAKAHPEAVRRLDVKAKKNTAAAYVAPKKGPTK